MEAAPAADRDRILNHLRTVLASRPFRKNRRARIYLHYVVTETVDGRAEQLSEASVRGIVFGDEEAVSDSRVPAKIADVNLRLNRFYASVDPITPVWLALDRISLAPMIGPSHRIRPPWPGTEGSISHSYVPAVAAQPEVRPARTWAPVLPGFGLVAIAIAVAVLWPGGIGKEPPKPPPIWNPFLHRDRVVILCEPQLAPEMTQLGPMFQQQKSAIDSKMGSQITRTDIRLFPTVLFSGCTSPWSEALAQGLRFRSVIPQWAREAPPSAWLLVPQNVMDTQTGRSWAGAVLVTRLLDSGNGQPLLMIEGWTQTQSSVIEMLRRETDLSKMLGPEWMTRNLQFVVQFPADAPPRIIAGHSWPLI